MHTYTHTYTHPQTHTVEDCDLVSYLALQTNFISLKLEVRSSRAVIYSSTTVRNPEYKKIELELG